MTARRIALALAFGLFAVVALIASRSRRRRAADYQGFADVHPSVLVTNPGVLVALEDAGFSLSAILGRQTRGDKVSHDPDYTAETAADLVASPLYADLARTLTADIDELEGQGRSVGVGVKYMHRVFDTRWLTSPLVHYELVGVSNRIDFRWLAPPGCGQTRLVYRLAYRPPHRPQTRLPLTISLLYENKGNDCARLAAAWLALEDGRDLAARLQSGPLAGTKMAAPDRIETNVQSLREDSQGISMDDHGEYILRSFVATGGRLVPGTLRNTPDPAMSDESKAALADWVAKNIAAIDSGSAEVPERFLATRATSFTPRGLRRASNRPYKALFGDERTVFGDVPKGRVVSSPEMLVRRLDEMTCPGCHEARSVAGFHLLGEERSAGTGNALTLGISEHLRQVVEWRYRFLQGAAAATAGPAEPVPVSEHVDDSGGYGAHCTHVHGTVDDGLPDWPCAAGLVCRVGDVEGDPVGACSAPGPLHIGDGCERADLVPGTDHDGDYVAPRRSARCGAPELGAANDERCRLSREGFPGGMCTATCTLEGERRGDSVCMRIPHKGFERVCFLEGMTLERCLRIPGSFAIERMRSCSRTEPCRDDFVCSRVPGFPADQGACVPPYFVFQARVDGPPIDR